MTERVVLVSPRGFCAGVVRAIAAVERALELYGPPVFVRRAIVHNSHVVERLAAAGAVFVNELDEVPRESVVVLSAHGVAASVYEEARARGLRVVDATCPLVAKVHREVKRFSGLGFDVILIGQSGHDEVVGTLGQAPGVRLVEDAGDASSLRGIDPDRVACVTQTTLGVQDIAPVIAALRTCFPQLVEPGVADICYATRNRQAAATWLGGTVDVVLVVGDRTSSNSRHLRDAASATGTPAYLIGSVTELQDEWIRDARVVGVSAGASTPEQLVADVVTHLCRDGATLHDEVFVEERVTFPLPRALMSQAQSAGSLDAAQVRDAGSALIGRMLRIRIDERGRPDVDASAPLTLARRGITFGAVAVTRDLARHGIDLERLLDRVTTAGAVVDRTDEIGRVRIDIE